MIAFKDFVPRQTRKPGFIDYGQWETVEQMVAAANEWIREQEVTIINVETVAVPDLWRKDVAQNGNSHLPGNTNTLSGWFQFVRVWYRAE